MQPVPSHRPPFHSTKGAPTSVGSAPRPVAQQPNMSIDPAERLANHYAIDRIVLAGMGMVRRSSPGGGPRISRLGFDFALHVSYSQKRCSRTPDATAGRRLFFARLLTRWSSPPDLTTSEALALDDRYALTRRQRHLIAEAASPAIDNISFASSCRVVLGTTLTLRHLASSTPMTRT